MKVFVLTGAGISAESGLGTFRDPGGLCGDSTRCGSPRPRPSPTSPRRSTPSTTCAGRGAGGGAQPAHAGAARLEAGLAASGGRLFLCTQNVDDLHERAGSRAVITCNGELMRARCTACGAGRPWAEDLSVDTASRPAGGGAGCARTWSGSARCRAISRPIAAALDESDLFVAIGTSGASNPAAGFVARAREAGIPDPRDQPRPLRHSRLFTEATYGPATQAVPACVDDLLREVSGEVSGKVSGSTP